MMTSTGTGERADGTEVVKWYTRARRFPQLIGKTPDGATIWGGPYTYTQVGAGVAYIVVGSKTTWLWGHFGGVGNVLVLFGSAYALVLALGRIPLGTRNPLSAVLGALRAVTAPTHGHLAGSPLRLRRPRPIRGRTLISNPAPLPSQPAPRPRPRWARRPPSQQPPRLTPSPVQPQPAPPLPALTGVQQLLAAAGTHHQES